MNEEKYLSYSDILGLGEFAVFCGAGISWNSGLPLANELKQSILEKLPIDKEDIEEIMKAILPFEAFIEIISENTEISKIIDIFKGGRPNTNHILIARFAKKGYLKTIFTTNFDLLIEKALEKEGLKEDVDFKRYYNEEHFSEIDFDNLDDKIQIFKIHGSADKEDSIRTTLKAVARKTLSDKRINAIRYLFSNGKHKKVLILGYSCSDEFDITPQIQNIEKSPKEIIVVEHSEKGIEINDIKIKNYKNPFKNFQGKRIKYDTDKFIGELWGSFKETLGEYHLNKFESQWKTSLNDWIEELENYVQYFVVGSLFAKISNFNKMTEYFEKSLEMCKKIDDKFGEALCCGGLGIAYHNTGNFTKAIEYNERASVLAKDIGDKEGESRYYTNLGVVYEQLGDFKKAIAYHEKSLEIAKNIINIDKGVELRYYGNLGSVYDRLGDFKNAIKYHEKFLEVCKEVGDKVGEAGCYGNIGVVYEQLEDFQKAFEYYERSLEIAKNVGDKVKELKCYVNLGNVHDRLEDFQKAFEYYEKSLEIAKNIGDKDSEAACYGNLGVVYGELGDFKKALECCEKSLELAKNTGHKERESLCYVNLGVVYGTFEIFEKSLEFFLKAEEIFEETEQIHYLMSVYKNLSLVYGKIGDIENAKKYMKKLEQIQK
jgi:tetratricopeptide (TPR) repeat protein